MRVKEMKNTFKRIFCILLTLCMIIVPLAALSSCSKEDGQNGETTGDVGYSSFEEGFTDKKVTDEDSVIAAIESVADELGIKDPDKELKVEDSTPVGDDTYYRVQQYYNDIPVYGKTIALSADKDGNVTALTSNSINTPEGIDTTPSASMEDIENTVVDYFKNTVGVTDAEGNIKIGELGKDHLYIYEKDDDTAVLAYVIQVGFKEMVIDADTAEIVVVYNTVNEDSTEMCFNADGSENFYGYYSKSEDTHIAYNEERGITIYNYVNQDSTLTSGYGIRLESEDVYFGNVVDGNTTEADRDFGKGVTYINNLSKIYDYYNEHFSEKAYGEFVACYNDGYYNGENALGGRTSDNKGYLSMGSVTGVDCLDTMAHEYTHVVSRHNVKWVSIDAWLKETDEPGAINEGYSDIFGELIEAEINGTAPDWIHGERNIKDPMSNNYPAKIGDRPYEEFTNSKGKQCWGMPTGGGYYTDYSHGFSTIISHSAYLMWNGIDGTESKKIDADILANLWYRAMLLLQSDATFEQCANAVVSVAQHMYRKNPAFFTIDKLNCVKEAFENVGLTSGGYTPVSNGSTVFAIEKNSTVSYNNYHVLVESINFSKNTATKTAEADVTNRSGYKLDLDPGAYRITVSDNTENGSKSTFSKNIRILKQGGEDSVPLRASSINIYTDFKAPIPVTDFTIPDELIVTLGELGIIEPEFEPYDATGYTIKWSSSDESVANVTPTGEAAIITTHAKGSTVITAELTSNGKTITKTTNVRVASKGRDTVLVLDVSGSMYGDPLREMKESAIKFCNDLLKDEYNNRVGLVFYDNTIVTVDLTNDLDMLISRIQAVDDGGRTNMEGGLAAADYMLEELGNDNAIKNVVVMADGLPNLGNTSSSGSMPQGSYSGYNTSVKYASAVIDTAKSMMSKYNMYSLGFFHGLYGDEKEFAATLMKELTNMPDGYYQVEKAEELQFAFGDISSEISVSSKIVINIACPVDVTITYGGESLSSRETDFNDVTSFGTMHLMGKDNDVKVASLDSDKEYDVKLTGTGDGKMDYSVNYFDEDEELEDYRSFEAVPITPTTIITTNTSNNSKDVTLNVDEDGDGEVDTIWTALEKSEGKITYEKNPTEPEESEDPEESVPAWSIALIAGVGILGVGGIVLAIVLAAHKGRNKEKDIYVPVIEQNGEENNVLVAPVVNEQRTASAASGRIIQVSGGSMNGFEVPIMDGETLYLGKDPKIANIVFTSDYKNVSRMHCTITFDLKTNKYYVTDCSSNGTYLAGGDRLTKGKRTAVGINTTLILANNDCVVILR